MKDLPMSSDILEELAAKVQAEIGKLSFSSFQTAFDEMIDFHKFLLATYTTEDIESKNEFSFAQMGLRYPLHQEWISKYRNIFGRAIGIIGDRDESAQRFIEILMETALLLLPLKDEKLVLEVTVALFDLDLMLAHHLQDWAVQNHIASQYPETEKTTKRSIKNLQKKYENITQSFIHSSENLLKRIPSLYSWDTNKNEDLNNDNRWIYFRSSWTLLQKHLFNTSYFLVISVWNEDHTSSKYYCEALINWLKPIEFTLGRNDFYIPSELLTPNQLDKNWEELMDFFRPFLQHPSLEKNLNPTNLFTIILNNTLRDIIIIVVGVILGWVLAGKQETDIAPKISLELIRKIFPFPSAKSNYYDLFISIIRILICNDHFSDTGYGKILDDFTRRFDILSERSIIPGRIYTPSTSYNRYALSEAWMLVLTSTLPPEEQTENEITKIYKLTDKENLFPKTDSSIRNLTEYLKEIRNKIPEKPTEIILDCFSVLSSKKDFNQARLRTTEMLDSLLEGIEDQRKSRLCSRPIDPGKLQEIENVAEKNAFDKNTGNFPLYLFDKVSYSNNLLDEFTLSISRYSKGCLINPPMDYEAVKRKDVCATLYHYIGEILINDALKRANKQEELVDSGEKYWDEIQKFTSKEKNSYILVVCSHSKPTWLQTWEESGYSNNDQSLPNNLKVLKSDFCKNQPGYLFHLNDIAVYSASIEPNHSFLIPSGFFKQAEFTIYPNGKKIKADFESDPDNALWGTIRLTFAWHVKIDNDIILHLNSNKDRAV